MHSVLRPLIAGLYSVCRAGTLLTFSVLVAVVVLQVLGRIPGFASPTWTEEVARFALVYVVAFSCGIAALSFEDRLGEINELRPWLHSPPSKNTELGGTWVE